MPIPILLIVAFVFIVFYLGYRREQNDKKQHIEKLLQNHGKPPIRKMSQDELNAVKLFCHNKGKLAIDDISWNDLDMDIIYKAMNYCLTSAGDEYLYHRLHSPFDTDYDWTAFEDKLSVLANDTDIRKQLITCLSKMGRTGKYNIYSYMQSMDDVKLWPDMYDWGLNLLYIPAALICFYNGLIGAILLFAVMAINIATYFKKKRAVDSYLICFQYVSRVIENSTRLFSIDSAVFKDEISALRVSISELKEFSSYSSLVLSNLGNSPIAILLDYIKMLTHVDLIKFKHMFRCIRDKKDNIEQMLDIIGRIDTIYSVAEYRAWINNYCVPDLNNSYLSLDIKEGYHPLIKNPVNNSINTNRSVLLTGSNASGKSTFLKMIAVNSILAQTIHTCLAQSYKAPYYRIYSSLSLKDSIVHGDSYYMAEIKAIKRIVDATDNKVRVLCFVDEILRGTNTVERIAASCAILKELSLNNALVFAASHDIELTSMLDNYDNYHFEEKMTDDDISFSYQLMPGEAKTRNAIKLLEVLGYDKEIVAQSKEYVQLYEQKGCWI